MTESSVTIFRVRFLPKNQRFFPLKHPKCYIFSRLRRIRTLFPLEITILRSKTCIFRACGAPNINDLPLEIAVLGSRKSIFPGPPKATVSNFGGFQKT